MADKKEKQQSRMRKKEEEREKLKHTKIGRVQGGECRLYESDPAGAGKL